MRGLIVVAVLVLYGIGVAVLQVVSPRRRFPRNTDGHPKFFKSQERSSRE